MRLCWSVHQTLSLPCVLSSRGPRGHLRIPQHAGVFVSLLIWALCLFDELSVALIVFVSKGLWSLLA